MIASPFDWFYTQYNSNGFGPSSKQLYINILQKGKEEFPGENNNAAFTVQSEDRIWSNAALLEDFSSFVTRVDILIKGDLSIWVNNIKKACESSNGDWKNKIYIYTNRNDFNAQNNKCFYLGRLLENKITVDDIKYMVNEIVNKVKGTETLYRINNKCDYDCIWLTTSKEYAEEMGEYSVKEIPLTILNNLACEEDAMDYLIDEKYRGTDPWSGHEFYLNNRNNFDVEKMEINGYTGYFYHDNERNCVNVCLFRDKQI